MASRSIDSLTIATEILEGMEKQPSPLTEKGGQHHGVCG
jgi:hypothetical protein